VDEEDPLEHLAVVVRLGRGVERELALLVVVLAEVEEDRGGLEDVEVAAVRVDDRRAACGSSGWDSERARTRRTHIRPFGCHKSISTTARKFTYTVRTLIAMNHGSFSVRLGEQQLCFRKRSTDGGWS
jgi:hypothetical protein